MFKLIDNVSFPKASLLHLNILTEEYLELGDPLPELVQLMSRYMYKFVKYLHSVKSTLICRT